MAKTVNPVVVAREVILPAPPGVDREVIVERVVKWSNIQQGDTCAEFDGMCAYRNAYGDGHRHFWRRRSVHRPAGTP